MQGRKARQTRSILPAAHLRQRRFALAFLACAVPLGCQKLYGLTEPPLSCSAARGYEATGKASWYGGDFQGQRTASGERFDLNEMTAAHRRLPFGTRILVTNLENNKSVEVVVNDRGPYVPGRLVDLSKGAAEELSFAQEGIVPVRVETLRVCGEVSRES